MPVHGGHIKVKQNQVGLNLLHELDALKTIGGFAHDLKVVLTRQKRLQTAAEKRVIVNERNPDFFDCLSVIGGFHAFDSQKSSKTAQTETAAQSLTVKCVLRVRGAFIGSSRGRTAFLGLGLRLC